MKHSLIPLLASIAFANQAIADKTTNETSSETELDTVKVTADFRQTDVMEIPSSITVLGNEQIEQRNASHIEDLLALSPNVNFASGSSRGRYYQIRGIGERSQFVDPVSPSVGLYIDNIDMTGLGAAATLFDVAQVEILRGPQGTSFGANALAGAINIKSVRPTTEKAGYVKSLTGNYGTTESGAAFSSDILESTNARFAYNHFKSDGYMNNVFLDRQDTNKFDEQVAKLLIDSQINESNSLESTLLLADIDNGYDAFSLTNTRNTFSDKPGFDRQETKAASIKWTNSTSNNFILEAVASGSINDSTYSYDEDWSFGAYNSNSECITKCIVDVDPLGWAYSTFDKYQRKTNRADLDIRALSTTNSKLFSDTTDWVMGFHNRSNYNKLERFYTVNSDADENNNEDGIANSSTSYYTNRIESFSSAFYAELKTFINASTQVSYGIRIEEWQADFKDFSVINDSSSETLFGGQVSLEHLLTPNHLGYANFSRGFKAGGFNSDTNVSKENREFSTEYNNSIEFGLKSSILSDQLSSRLAVFYTQRKDQQVKSSYIIPADQPNEAPTFQDYTANAAEGINYGFEAEMDWAISPSLNWQLSIGLLNTEFDDYEYSTNDGTFSKTGREQAHAPSWSLASSVSKKITDRLKLIVSVEGKDEYYFSDSHDEKTDAYGLVNARIEYKLNRLELALSGQNLSDEDYATRGFGFGNNPDNGYSDTQHTQLGNPRLISLSAKYNF